MLVPDPVSRAAVEPLISTWSRRSRAARKGEGGDGEATYGPFARLRLPKIEFPFHLTVHRVYGNDEHRARIVNDIRFGRCW